MEKDRNRKSLKTHGLRPLTPQGREKLRPGKKEKAYSRLTQGRNWYQKREKI